MNEALRKATKPRIHSHEYWLADGRIVNLEQVLAELNPIESKGSLVGPPKLAHSLRSDMGVTAVAGANNHTHDCGDAGIHSTLRSLDDAELPVAGLGRDDADATKAVTLSDGLVLMSLCDYGRPYLQQVQTAQGRPGVAGLRFDRIYKMLDGLAAGTQAIVFVHWGREHVWFPSARDLQLARLILSHPRVALVVGSHPHRIQGWVSHRGKRAYMSLGNFFFDEFLIDPPQRISAEQPSPSFPTTSAYHRVSETTWKRWPYVNRLSMIVMYDSETEASKPMLVEQRDAEVRQLPPGRNLAVLAFVRLLSTLYSSPAPIYRVTSRVCNSASWGRYYARIAAYRLRTVGPRETLRRTARTVRSLLA